MADKIKVFKIAAIAKLLQISKKEVLEALVELKRSNMIIQYSYHKEYQLIFIKINPNIELFL